MYNIESFTKKANIVISKAFLQAGRLGHTYVGSEHLLLALVSEQGCTASTAFRQCGIREEDVLRRIVALVGRGDPSVVGDSSITPAAKKAISRAVEIASAAGCRLAGTEHLLSALISQESCTAVEIINDLGGSLSRLSGACSGTAQIQFSAPPKLNVLNKYGRDLTKAAAEKKCDPVFCRDKETERIIRILSRRTKNNPCLIGEAGVGKTAIVEGIAALIAEGKVPMSLRGKRIYSLNLTSMLAGAKYRGDFEDRIKQCLDEVAESGCIILFIDELHTIVGAGAAEGAIDAANILKPQLSRGELQIIGATTLNEYRRYIERDSALARRFQQVFVREPSETEAVEIICGLKKCYEDFHHAVISDDAVKAAVELSVRYQPDRFLPDKAIDLIDEAASGARMKASKSPRTLEQLSVSLKAMLEQQSAENMHRYNLNRRDKLPSWYSPSEEKPVAVTREAIAEIISASTGIPAEEITNGERARLLRLEEELHKRVIGQDEAVKAVSDAIRRSRSGLRDPARPMGCFLFTGPTGSGKTELSKALSETLFGSSKSLIRFDMSEFMEKHSVSKFIGSPPGYVGYDDGGALSERVRKNPYSVVLFDEIEKAHPEIFNILLQIFDEGMITDSSGRTVNFRNTVIILTSNIGSAQASEEKSVGFTGGSSDKKGNILSEIRRYFSPELMGRLDEIVVFDKLDAKQLRGVAMLMLEGLRKRAETMEISLEFSAEAVDRLVEFGKEKSGARKLRHNITENVENLLSRQLLEGKVKRGDSIELVFDKAFSFKEVQLQM